MKIVQDFKNGNHGMFDKNRFVSVDRRCAIIMQPPMKRMINLNYHYSLFDEKNPRKLYRVDCEGNYFLSMPHIFYRIGYYEHKGKFGLINLKVAFANSEKPTSVCYPLLGNINNELSVCIGKRINQSKTTDKLFKDIIRSFWSTEFNDGIYACLSINRVDRKLIEEWADKTKTKLWHPKLKKIYSYPEFIFRN